MTSMEPRVRQLQAANHLTNEEHHNGGTNKNSSEVSISSANQLICSAIEGYDGNKRGVKDYGNEDHVETSSRATEETLEKNHGSNGDICNNSTNRPNKPQRPFTEYNVFFQLEREYILQSMGGGFASYACEEEQDGDAATRPERYKNLILPIGWYRVGKAKARKQRRTQLANSNAGSSNTDACDSERGHGKITFLQLTKMISRGWAAADLETKKYCKSIALKELERYRRDMKAYVEKYGQPEKRKKKKKKGRKLLGFGIEGFNDLRRNHLGLGGTESMGGGGPQTSISGAGDTADNLGHSKPTEGKESWCQNAISGVMLCQTTSDGRLSGASSSSSALALTAKSMGCLTDSQTNVDLPHSGSKTSTFDPSIESLKEQSMSPSDLSIHTMNSSLQNRQLSFPSACVSSKLRPMYDKSDEGQFSLYEPSMHEDAAAQIDQEVDFFLQCLEHEQKFDPNMNAPAANNVDVDNSGENATVRQCAIADVLDTNSHSARANPFINLTNDAAKGDAAQSSLLRRSLVERNSQTKPDTVFAKKQSHSLARDSSSSPIPQQVRMDSFIFHQPQQTRDDEMASFFDMMTQKRSQGLHENSIDPHQNLNDSSRRNEVAFNESRTSIDRIRSLELFPQFSPSNTYCAEAVSSRAPAHIDHADAIVRQKSQEVATGNHIKVPFLHQVDGGEFQRLAMAAAAAASAQETLTTSMSQLVRNGQHFGSGANENKRNMCNIVKNSDDYNVLEQNSCLSSRIIEDKGKEAQWMCKPLNDISIPHERVTNFRENISGSLNHQRKHNRDLCGGAYSHGLNKRDHREFREDHVINLQKCRNSLQYRRGGAHRAIHTADTDFEKMHQHPKISRQIDQKLRSNTWSYDGELR